MRYTLYTAVLIGLVLLSGIYNSYDKSTIQKLQETYKNTEGAWSDMKWYGTVLCAPKKTDDGAYVIDSTGKRVCSRLTNVDINFYTMTKALFGVTSSILIALFLVLLPVPLMFLSLNAKGVTSNSTIVILAVSLLEATAMSWSNLVFKVTHRLVSYIFSGDTISLIVVVIIAGLGIFYVAASSFSPQNRASLLRKIRNSTRAGGGYRSSTRDHTRGDSNRSSLGDSNRSPIGDHRQAAGAGFNRTPTGSVHNRPPVVNYSDEDEDDPEATNSALLKKKKY